MNTKFKEKAQENEGSTAYRDPVSGASAENSGLREIYPLAQNQKGILADCLAKPDTTFYNLPVLYRLSDRLDLMRLKKAVETAAAAHLYISSSIVTDSDGDFRVKRNYGAAPTVEYIETARLPDDLIIPFDLMKDNLCRLRIYKTDDGSYLFIDIHHIVFDGTSLAVLAHDINTAYSGGEVLPETYTGFDCASDEEKLRQTEKYESARAYYEKLLSGAEPEMLPEGDVSGEAPSLGYFSVDTDITGAEVSAFCRKNNVKKTPFFNAVFAFVLGKYNCRNDVLYTTVYNGRKDPRTEHIVSMLVKTFPVFCHIDADQTASAFAQDLGRQIEESKENDIYSFAEIANEHNISPDIIFSYQGRDFLINSIGGEPAEQTFMELSEAKVPLHIDLYEKDGKLLFSGDYRKNLFSADYVNRMIACLEHTLREFLKDPVLKNVCIANESTCKEMDALNATETDVPDTDIVSLFRAAAEKYPDREAVIFRDEVLSYRQTDEISGRIAGSLRSNGIGKGKVVSVLVHRGTAMVTASLGVLKTGAAYQPLDPGYPAERLSFMMTDADCALLIADEDLLEKVPDYKGKVLLTKEIPTLPVCEDTPGAISPSDLFILLYTSGSTGTPKGVMLEHRNLVNFVTWYRGFYSLDENSRVAAALSIISCCSTSALIRAI